MTGGRLGRFVIGGSLELLEGSLAGIPPDGLTAVAGVDVSEGVHRRLHAPDFLQLELVPHAAAGWQVEVPLRRVVRDQHVHIVGDGVAPGVLSPVVLEGELLAAALWDLRRPVDFQLSLVREVQGDGRVLQVVDFAPVQRAVSVFLVVQTPAALVEIAVVVAAHHDDVEKAI